MHVAGLAIYPIKSARAVPLRESAVDVLGLSGDRRFMVVSPDGRFMTQRQVHILARLEVEVHGDALCLHMDGNSVTGGFTPARMDVTVWSSAVNAAIAEEPVNQALTAWLGRPAVLVAMDDQSSRLAEDDWLDAPVSTSFTDGFPVLIANLASLSAVNQTLEGLGQPPVGIERFRANIVIDDAQPWVEDTWKTVQIGEVTLDLVKPCTRCVVTSIDQMTGERQGGNPLQALQRTRMSGDRRVAGVLFGWDAIVRKTGVIRCGDPLTVVTTRPEGIPLKIRSSS